MSVQDLQLNNGMKIPPIGFGTFCGKELEEIIAKGVDVGCRLIDTAFIYNNEDQIGRALDGKLKEGTINREDLFIVSKLWNTKHHPTDVLPAIKRSLKDLRLSYVDLYLIHWPFAMKGTEDEYELFNLLEDDVLFEDTWKAMEECVKLGYAKSIGLSNFNSQQIERILKIATIKPVVNQIECNPYLSQEKLREFCKQKDIVIMAYCPLYAPGHLGAKAELNLFEEPVIQELAKKYEKTLAQIILRYLVQCEVIPIPKTDKLERLQSNMDIFDFCLTPDDFLKMRSLNKNKRCVEYNEARKFKEYPFSIEF